MIHLIIHSICFGKQIIQPILSFLSESLIQFKIKFIPKKYPFIHLKKKMAYRTGLCHSHSRHGHYGYHGPGHSSCQLAMVMISYMSV